MTSTSRRRWTGRINVTSAQRGGAVCWIPDMTPEIADAIVSSQVIGSDGVCAFRRTRSRSGRRRGGCS